jgi:hypothetical protein
MTISPNGKNLFTVDEPGRFRHWDLANGRLAKGWEYEANIQGCCFSLVITPDNKNVFLGNYCEITTNLRRQKRIGIPKQ